MGVPLKFVIVGGGTAGTLSALNLKKRFPHSTVTMIRSPEIDIIGVGESTTYLVPFFLHEVLDIPVERFFTCVKASIKTGTRLEWNKAGPYYYSFDDALVAWDRSEIPWEPGFFCIDDLEAQRKSSFFSWTMSENRAPFVGVPHDSSCVLPKGQYGYHFDNHLFVAFLETLCAERGITIISETVTSLRSGNDGNVTEAVTASGCVIYGDFFVDCTGFKSQILKEHIGVTTHKYPHLLARRAVVGWQQERVRPIRPYTRSRALPCGWLFTIDHRSTAHGYVYSPAHVDDEAALTTFLQQTDAPVTSTRVIHFEPRRLGQIWCRNAVAMGNAAGFLEPLQSTAIHMIAQQNMWLADFLAIEGPTEPKVSRYNTMVSQLWDCTASFIALHYVFQSVHCNQFWSDAGQVAWAGLGAFADAVATFEAYGPTTVLRWRLNDIPLFGTLGFVTNMLGLGAPTRADRRYHSGWEQRCQRISGQVQQAPLLEEVMSDLWGSTNVTLL